MPVLFPEESRSGIPNSGIPYDKSTLTLSVDTQASLTQTRNGGVSSSQETPARFFLINSRKDFPHVDSVRREQKK